MARTRGRCKKEVRESLPLDSDLLVHVFTALSLNHGTDCLEIASAVCRRWHERVAGGRALDEDPENCIGELRSGDKPHRFDRPHDALFLPNGDICVADCDNFRLQIVSREGYYMCALARDTVPRPHDMSQPRARCLPLLATALPPSPHPRVHAGVRFPSAAVPRAQLAWPLGARASSSSNTARTR